VKYGDQLAFLGQNVSDLNSYFFYKKSIKKRTKKIHMLKYQVFEFSPFAENTYILYETDTKTAWCIDPGCYDAYERKTLTDFIATEGLTLVRLLNTHAHLDHIFGNAYVSQTYGLLPESHRGELVVYERFMDVCKMYGIPNVAKSPLPQVFLEDNQILHLGNYTFTCILAPGHSPASLCFYCEAEGLLIGGDVLFLEGVGRTDLPGGDHATLMQSIKTRILTLPDSTMVLPGHGPATTVRHEREYNPFI
jgi:hydroxyacylglutathione hydrolase